MYVLYNMYNVTLKMQWICFFKSSFVIVKIFEVCGEVCGVGGEVEVMSPLRGWCTQVYSRLAGLQTPPGDHHSQTFSSTSIYERLPGLINPAQHQQKNKLFINTMGREKVLFESPG